MSVGFPTSNKFHRHYTYIDNNEQNCNSCPEETEKTDEHVSILQHDVCWTFMLRSSDSLISC